MKTLFAAVFAVGLAFSAEKAIAATDSVTTIHKQEVGHGGGCRKSSPPGQCCHMDKSTGTVHCH